MRVLLGVLLVLMATPAFVGGLLLLDTLFRLAYGLTAILLEGASVWFTNLRHPQSAKYSGPLPFIRS